MKLLYFTIAVLLIMSLAGLEIISAHLPDDTVSGSTPAPVELFGP